jgi:hypothetical protein
MIGIATGVRGKDCYDRMLKATKTSHELIKESKERKKERKTMAHAKINIEETVV